MIQFPAATWLAAAASWLLLLVLPLAPAQAAERGLFMELGARVAPPRGYIDFCAREPGECPAALRSRPAAAADGVPVAPMSDYWRMVFEAVEPAALPQRPFGRSRARASTDPVGRFAGGGGTTTAAGAGFQPLALTPSLIQDLDDLNTSINRQIRARSDAEVYGRSDYWGLPLDGRRTPVGDCEDYVLEKRRALRARGYPDNLLSIALVTTSWGESHAVLLVQTDQGELVLDSLDSRIVPWRDSTHRWVSRQSPEDAAIWIAAGPRRRSFR